MTKRIIIIVGILVVLIGGSWLLYSRSENKKENAETSSYQTYVVKRGNIIALVNASGNVEDAAQIGLSFGSSGEVTALFVKEGDRVHNGDLLAQVDQRSAELQVRHAQANLKSAQARLDQLLEPPDSKDVAAAKASLAAAQAKYDKWLEGPSEDEIASAKAGVDRAKAQLDLAQAAYDRVKYRPDIAMLPQSLQLQDATISYQQALAQYRLAKQGASNAQLASAKAQIAQAEAQLAKLLKGADPYQVTIAKTQVETAQVALEQAKLLLEKTSLTAPMDGTVAQVNIVKGQTFVGAGKPAILLDDASGFHLEVLVDELDVRSVRVGQDATISLDADPDVTLHGQVAYVSPVSTVEAGAVSYRVRVNLDPTDFPLRSGMSAVANIVTQSKQNVVLVPNRYLRLDRQTGQTIVQKLVDNIPQATVVALGVRNDQMSEVLSGLQPGDTIALIRPNSKAKLQAQFGGR